MKRAIIPAAALAATSLVALAGPAHAEPCDILEDETKPTFVSSSISPSSIVIGKTKKTIKVTVSARDNCGVDGINVTLNPKGNSAGGMIYLYEFTRTAGTPTNGTWTATKVLSDYEDGGAWVATEVEIDDINYNSTTRLYAPGSLQIRHATATKLSKPKSSVKKNKKVTLKGSIHLYGVLDETTSLKVQAKTSGKWKTIKTIKSDFFGSYSTKIKVTKTKTYRVTHLQDGVSTASTSKSYKVKKK